MVGQTQPEATNSREEKRAEQEEHQSKDLEEVRNQAETSVPNENEHLEKLERRQRGEAERIGNAEKQAGSRELGKTSPDYAGYVTFLNARVTSLRFFESGEGILPFSRRIYGQSFRSSTTRFINWELSLSYPIPEKRTDFDIVEVWRKPHGTVTTHAIPVYVDHNWTGSQCGSGHGSPRAGTFQLGTYQLELFINGQRIASGTFEVY